MNDNFNFNNKNYFNNKNNFNNNNNNNNNNNLILSNKPDNLYKFQYFLCIILVGYFGIKIFLSSFNKYPNKFYEKKIVINYNNNNNIDEENNNNDKNLIMDYFIPGIINNEIYDIIITIVLSSIIFIITGIYKRKSFAYISITNFIFIIGYCIGLNAPLYKSFFEEDNNSSFVNYTYLIIFILLMGFMILFSSIGAYNSNKLSLNYGLSGYILYLIVISLLIIGLIINKKKIITYNTVIYNYNNSCNSSSFGAYQSNGEYINISMTFLSFILLFIFVYDPPTNGMISLYYLINGLLFGIFISGMSFYGFDYFLNKKPDQYCNNEIDCKKKNIQIGNQVISYNDSNQLYILKWLVGILSIIILIIIIYLFYNKN